MMSSLKFDLTDKTHHFKVLNAVNGGPLHRSHLADDKRSNFEDYKALRIPYNRTHDANHHGIYGGPYAYDISAVFPNFDSDPYDPASYDFACTDEAVKVSMEAGTKVFYRLGESIEHTIVKHVAHPPKDFKSGQSSVNTLSVIIRKVGQMALSMTWNTGKSGTSRICEKRNRMIGRTGQEQDLNFLTCTRLQQSI